MKKTTANRRKKLPLLLGALLIVSMAAYGTRAYFSDSAEQQADIKLTLGNLDINPVDEKGWKYVPLGGKENSALTEIFENEKPKNNTELTETYAADIKYVQPGDQFERIFVFENIGELAQKVKVTNGVVDEGIFDVSFQQVDSPTGNNPREAEETTIQKDDKVYYKMNIAVKTGDGINEQYNNQNGQTVNDDLVFDALETAVKVDAEQTNN